ncbi:MAG: hypothetical protein AAF548_17665, partial [Actinomycetota bacterium]
MAVTGFAIVLPTTPAASEGDPVPDPATTRIDFEGLPTGGIGAVAVADVGTVAIDATAGVPAVFDSRCTGGCAGWSAELQTDRLGNALMVAVPPADLLRVTGDDAAALRLTFPVPVHVHRFSTHDLTTPGARADFTTPAGTVSIGMSNETAEPRRVTAGVDDVTAIDFRLDGSGLIDDIVVSPMTGCGAGYVLVAGSCTTTTTTTTTVPCVAPRVVIDGVCTTTTVSQPPTTPPPSQPPTTPPPSQPPTTPPPSQPPTTP